MDNDDKPIGRILTRREILKLFGYAGATVLAGCATAPTATVQVRTATAPPANTATSAATSAATRVIPTTAPATLAPSATAAAASTNTPQAVSAASATAIPSCVASPELTEGPYFVDERLNRSDVRTDPTDGSVKDGAQLDLAIRVLKVGSAACAPLAGAIVDIWQCDALGVYSDASDRTFNTQGKKFLRGYQVTDSQGLVKFTTIYPGWYPGRAVHIHFKVRAPAAAGRANEFTSQFFFDEALNTAVFKTAPYSSKGTGWQRNTSDGIYQQSRGLTTLNVVKSGAGYASTFDVGMKI